MVEQVSLASLARQQAEKLVNDSRNKKAGVPKGTICKEVWDEFVAKTGVKKHGKVDYNISVANATKSIMTYARRVDNQNEVDIVQRWLNGTASPVPPKKEAKSQKQQPVAPNPPAENDNYKQKVITPSPKATSKKMAEHDAQVRKYADQASKIIDNTNPDKSFVNFRDPKYSIGTTFAQLNAKNIAYVLQKEPQFIEKMLDKYGDDLSAKEKKELVKGILKSIGSAIKTDGMSTEQMIAEVKKFASAHPVETKYGNQTIQVQRGKEKAGDEAKLQGFVKIPAKVNTPKTDAIKVNAKAAEDAAKELRTFVKEDNEEGVKTKFRAVKPEQFPYLTDNDPTLLEAVKDLVSPNTLKVALKNKLGFNGNTDTMTVEQTIAKMKELMKHKRNVNQKQINAESVKVSQSNQRPAVLTAMSTVASFANPIDGKKFKPQAGKTENNVTPFTVQDKFGNKISFVKDEKGNVVSADVTTVKNKKSTTVHIDAKSFNVNKVNVPNANTQILKFIQANFK